MFEEYVLAFVAAAMAAVSQVSMKAGARRTGVGLRRTLPNRLYVLGYALMVLATVVMTYAIKYIPVSALAFILPTTQVFVLVLSRRFLAERLGFLQMVGISTIVVGIIVSNL